jgi:dimethylamine/trimethylamine dehydrogenase
MSHGVRTVTALGDCHAPGTIAAAVHAGHEYARELGEPADPDGIGFRREVTALSDAS